MTRDRGFSLVDTAVVVGVAGILGGMVLPLVLKTLQDARTARARHDLNVIAAAIVAQMQDTGGRPMADGGPGGCTGRTGSLWYSSPQVPSFGPLDWLRNFLGTNTFANLFCAQDRAAGNALFGLGRELARDRFQYRGAYLAESAAGQGDPWGHAYLVLGYNHRGQAANGPIWVVCAGPDGTVAPANLLGQEPGVGGALPAVWDYSGLSAGNLAVRVQ